LCPSSSSSSHFSSSSTLLPILLSSATKPFHFVFLSCIHKTHNYNCIEHFGSQLQTKSFKQHPINDYFLNGLEGSIQASTILQQCLRLL
jgi:hypothetical protein